MLDRLGFSDGVQYQFFGLGMMFVSFFMLAVGMLAYNGMKYIDIRPISSATIDKDAEGT